MFDIGQRVICVDGVSHPPLFPVVKGQIYTVREFVSGCEYGTGKPVKGVLLQGLENPNNEFGLEHGYLATRFRPIDEEHLYGLRELLVTPPKEKVGA